MNVLSSRLVPIALAGVIGSTPVLFGCARDDAEDHGQADAAEAPAATSGVAGAGENRAPARTEDGEWRIPAKDYASTRYSGLSQITTENVNRLRLAWTFSTGVLRGHEAAPIVAENTMYIVTPHPNILYALDLTRNGSLKWK